MSNMSKVTRPGITRILLLAASLVLAFPLIGAGQQAAQSRPTLNGPISEHELIQLIKHNKHKLASLVPSIQSRGLGFAVTPDVEKALRKAGADDAFIAAVKSQESSGQKGKGPGMSPEEAQAYNRLLGDRDPAKIIQDANDFAQKFPNSPFLTYVYGKEANAYQRQNDGPHAIEYAEKSLQLNPKNLFSLLTACSVLPQPQILQNVSDADKMKKLEQAETYANRALQEIAQLPQDPKEKASAYQERKNGASSEVYSALGMIHLERSQMALGQPDPGELAKAEQSYKMAISKSKSPNAADYYRLGDVYSMEGKLDDAIASYSKSAQLGEGTVIEQYADRQVQTLKEQKAKSQTKPAPKP